MTQLCWASKSLGVELWIFSNLVRRQMWFNNHINGPGFVEHKYFWIYSDTQQYIFFILSNKIYYGPAVSWTRVSSVQTRYLSHWTTGPYLYLGPVVFKFNYKRYERKQSFIFAILIINLGGDPTAGSPTVTLWRLNLPHHAKVLFRRISP